MHPPIISLCIQIWKYVYDFYKNIFFFFLSFFRLSASRESITLDYATHLRDQIIGPLIRNGADGVESALEILHEYQLLKDDLDSLQEICLWPSSKNHWASLDSKVSKYLNFQVGWYPEIF